MIKQYYMVMALAIAIAFNCTAKKPNDPGEVPPLSETINPIVLKIGNTYSYKRNFILVYSDTASDTVYSYQNITVPKDTVMDDRSYYIVEVDEYELSLFPSSGDYTEFKARYAISITDSGIQVLKFKQSKGSPLALFKSSGMTWSRYETVNKLVSLKMGQAGVTIDTTVYSDLNYPLVFPLVPDSSWYYRDNSVPNSFPYQKTYLGQEKVTVEGCEYLAYKIRWETDDAFGKPMGIIFYDWVGEFCLVKRYIDYGEQEMLDNSGEVIGTFNSYEYFVFTGTTLYDINSLIIAHGL